MTLQTSDQGIIFPAGTDVNDGVTAFASELGANPSTGASGTGGTESRLVKRYLSVTDRAARNPSPAAGELSYRADLADYESFIGGAWRRTTWLTAWGVIGGSSFATVGHNWNTVGTGEAVLTSAGGNMQTPTVTLRANRRYRVRARLTGILGSTTTTIIAHIRETNISGNIVAEQLWGINATFGNTFVIENEFDNGGADVNKVYCVSCSTTAGTASVGSSGGASAPTWLVVEDIGPAGVVTVQSYP